MGDVQRQLVAFGVLDELCEQAGDLEGKLKTLDGLKRHADVAMRKRNGRVQLVRHTRNHLAQ